MSAIITPCGRYRPRLERQIQPEGLIVCMLGVNPSTADAERDDHTIRKDMGFARRPGWKRIIKGNLFDYRSTDIKALRTADEPCHPDNDHHLFQMMTEADLVVACWGPLAKLPKHLRNRWRDVVDIADKAGKQIMCFGTAKDGQPLHTLMLGYDRQLVEWVRP